MNTESYPQVLLDGELIELGSSKALAYANVSDDELNERYIKGEIRIVTEQARYPIISVAAIVEDPTYKISPEYQRRHRWAEDRKSRLIESLIMNVPIPPIFLYEYDYSKYEVMDGLQRLTAIHEFYRGRFKLEGLTEWGELNGRKYNELPEKVREGIDRRYLSSVILLKETARNEADALRLKQLVFERINSGGVKLSGQETRNAIFDGALNQLCIKLSRNGALCRLWGIPAPEVGEAEGAPPSEERAKYDLFREMGDVELVLRFFAYRQKHKQHHSGESLSTYLDTYLREANFFPPETLDSLGRIFEQTAELAEKVLGEKAFYLYRKRTVNGQESWSWLERPATTVYDPLMFVLSQNLDSARVLMDKSEDVRTAIESFYQDNYGVFEGRNVNRTALIEREQKFKEFFSRFIN